MRACPSRESRALLVALAWLASAGVPARARGEDGLPAVSRQASASGALQVGAPVKGFGGWTLGDGPWSLEHHRKRHKDQALVVSFFATWCQPCVRSLPALRQARKDFAPEQVEFVFVAFGEEGEVVDRFVERNPLPGIVLADPFQKIGERFGVDRSLPRTFVVDPRGVLRAIFVVEGGDFGPRLAAAVREALDGAAGRP